MTDITPDEYRNRRSNRVLAFKTEGDMIKLIAPVAVKPAKAPMTPGSQICVEVPVDFLRALKLNGRTVRVKLGAGALDYAGFQSLLSQTKTRSRVSLRVGLLFFLFGKSSFSYSFWFTKDIQRSF